jgi:demethylmenaquinone methyltransferase/2-methoxy-6-polyprenyl-1,4-benzoquinol methylase
VEDRGCRAIDEENYYSSIRSYIRFLAPFYDTGTFFISGLRGKVVDFTNARKGSRVLDVGTGTGKQAFAFAKRGFDITGIDLSEEMIKIARKNNRYENGKFQIGDAASLPFEDNSFDVTCVSFALHDMIPTIRRKTVKEVVRVTKPHGTIVVVDYSLPKNKILRQLVFNIIKLYELYYPEFIRSDLKRLLKNSGIQVSEEHSVLLGAARIIKGIKNG